MEIVENFRIYQLQLFKNDLSALECLTSPARCHAKQKAAAGNSERHGLLLNHCGPTGRATAL
jgi:hypothetical protein